MTDHEIPTNNSAGRLVVILKKAVEIGVQKGDKLYISTICEAIGLTDNPTNRAESLCNLFSLIHQLESDLLLLKPTKIKNHKQTITELKGLIYSGYMGNFQICHN